MGKNTPLSIKGITASYPGQAEPAIKDISWTVKTGELAAIIGPNGAGKSTLLKSIMELIPTQNGSVEFFGAPLQASRKRIAYIPQRSAIDWDFPVSVLDVVLMGLYPQIGWFKWIKKDHKDLAMEALKKVGIAQLANRQIGALSGGQQQRTFLARALAQNADLYLMDEPFAGVDVPTQNKIIEIMNDLKAKDKTLIVVHHDLGTVERVFDTALLINQTVVGKGAVKSVLTKPKLSKAYGAPLSYLN